EQIKRVPNLVVLCSSDVDQLSWTSEEWRQTIFTHFVIEGLKGAASQGRAKRISAYELFEYVKQSVREWVWSNRDAVPEPILLGGEDLAKRIDVITVAGGYQASAPEEAKGASF